MKRCPKAGKVKLRNAGEAIRWIRRGESFGLYRCEVCGFFHMTKKYAPGKKPA